MVGSKPLRGRKVGRRRHPHVAEDRAPDPKQAHATFLARLVQSARRVEYGCRHGEPGTVCWTRTYPVVSVHSPSARSGLSATRRFAFRDDMFGRTQVIRHLPQSAHNVANAHLSVE